MHWLQRAFAGTVGLAVGYFGVVAVFKTDNEVGSGVLVAVGAALLVLGIQGTRIQRLGGSAASIDLEPASVSTVLLERADLEPDDAKAEGLVEAAAIIDPEGVKSAQHHALSYEDRLADALARLGVVAQREKEGMNGRRLDFLVRVNSGVEVAIEVLYRRSGTLTMSSVAESLDRAEAVMGQGVPLLVVTNAPLSRGVLDFNESPPLRGGSAEVITWNGPEDDGLLSRALGRAVRSRRTPT